MSYNNIGQGHHAEAEYDKALEYYQKSLAIKLKKLGSEHPSVATSYNNMAFVCKAKKDLAKAKEYWEKAHAIFLKRLGPSHPNTKLVKGQLDALKE
jgi:tetratricopeptide (TPR) repeat protein